MQVRSKTLSLVAFTVLQLAANGAQSAPSALASEYAQIAGVPYTTSVAAASASDTIAWATMRRGEVTVWTADGPAYQPRKLL
jgi:hypothetical protein